MNISLPHLFRDPSPYLKLTRSVYKFVDFKKNTCSNYSTCYLWCAAEGAGNSVTCNNTYTADSVSYTRMSSWQKVDFSSLNPLIFSIKKAGYWNNIDKPLPIFVRFSWLCMIWISQWGKNSVASPKPRIKKWLTCLHANGEKIGYAYLQHTQKYNMYKGIF